MVNYQAQVILMQDMGNFTSRAIVIRVTKQNTEQLDKLEFQLKNQQYFKYLPCNVWVYLD